MTARLVRLLAATVAVVFSFAAAAQTPAPSDADVALPQTASDHAAMAVTYEKKAAEWRQEAQTHRAMAAAWNRRHMDFKGGVRNPEAAKMEKHCMTIVRDAEKLASDAEWAARYHRARAKELQTSAVQTSEPKTSH
jgi:hypothetical protein